MRFSLPFTRNWPLFCVLFSLALLFPSLCSAQTANLQVTVLASPTAGRPQKVRGHIFYLLSESLATIEQEGLGSVPEPSLEAFTEELDLSDELKDWVKRTQITELQGEPFLSTLTNDDIMNVPEFQTAYISANLTMVGLGFPRPKVKLSDRTKDPEKWDKAYAKYLEEVRSYLELHPESRQGLDQELVELNPGAAWRRSRQQHGTRLRQEILRLIHSRYLAAQAETNLDGVARFSVPPGRYWLTNLWGEARAGDVRLRWELPIELPQEENYRLTLNNANALPDR